MNQDRNTTDTKETTSAAVTTFGAVQPQQASAVENIKEKITVVFFDKESTESTKTDDIALRLGYEQISKDAEKNSK